MQKLRQHKQSKAKQSKAKQSKAKQSKAKQSKAKQRRGAKLLYTLVLCTNVGSAVLKGVFTHFQLLKIS